MANDGAQATTAVVAPQTETDRLRRERERFIAFSFCRADMLLELDAARIIAFAAGPTGAVFGRPPEQLNGTAFADVVAEEDRALVHQLLRTADRGQRVRDARVRLQSATGSVSPPFELNGYRFNDLHSHYFLALRIAHDREESAEGRDEETGLIDADHFADVAKDRVKAMRAAGEDVNVTLVNLPELDELRERLDSDAERDLLDRLASRLRANSVDGDTAARIGDTGFGFVHDASVDVSKLQAQIAEIAKTADPTGKGLSVDAATTDASDPAVSPEDLAMGLVFTINEFREKGGEFTMQTLSEHITSLAEEAAHYAANFSSAVEDAKFDIVFQPIVNSRTGKLHHFEVLTRFRMEGEESPYKMITFAEEAGRIHEFDIAVVEKAVDWLKRQPINTKRAQVAVNISGRSVENATYTRQLRALLKENTWLQDKLLFEVTESARIHDLKAANAFIQGVRDLGYHVCLDDFGAGAASFQYLSSIDIDVVKLDGAAVQNAKELPKGKAFLSALTELCRKLSIETIAEMIETPDDLRFVRDCGVDYIQGYLIGKPSDDVRKFMGEPDPRLFKPH